MRLDRRVGRAHPIVAESQSITGRAAFTATVTVASSATEIHAAPIVVLSTDDLTVSCPATATFASYQTGVQDGPTVRTSTTEAVPITGAGACTCMLVKSPTRTDT